MSFEVLEDPVSRLAEMFRGVLRRWAQDTVFELEQKREILKRQAQQREKQLHAVAVAVPLTSVALHLHDTRGTALANACRGLELGVQAFALDPLAGFAGPPP